MFTYNQIYSVIHLHIYIDGRMSPERYYILVYRFTYETLSIEVNIIYIVWRYGPDTRTLYFSVRSIEY